MNCKRWLKVSALLIACGMGMTACDKYDLDQRLPENWGSSIYSYMDEHDFKTMKRIVDDLGYADVLGKTGSKTLFAANDEAFERFFKNNSWGVTSYEQLSLAQKKLLLFGAMGNNSIQAQDLSNVEAIDDSHDPIEGVAMRRATSLQTFDTVTIIKEKDMPRHPFPEHDYWKRYRERGQIVCMTDRSNTPVVQFVESQMAQNGITNADYEFLFGKKRVPGEVSINGQTVVEQNVRCSNGFIHVVGDVVTPLSNMAEIIRSNGGTNKYNELLNRFCVPYKFSDEDQRYYTEEYNRLFGDQYQRLYGTRVDSVYEKRFLSKRTHGKDLNGNSMALNITPDGNEGIEMLKYDPEWNSYYFSEAYKSKSEAMMRDMACMLVPSDAAMERFFNGEGRVLQEEFGSWDNVPNDIIAKLLNNNMFPSFIESVPSKFPKILNDANDPMGIKTGDVDKVLLGCNGAVYVTNKVFTPTSFISVSYPSTIYRKMRIMNWAIEQLQYTVYLNSLQSTYSFFIPANDAFLTYIDPVSYGKSNDDNKSIREIYEFHYDETKPVDQRVWAGVWEYDELSQTKGDSIREASYYELRNHLKDVLDTHIIIGKVTPEHKYYLTKGGMALRIENVEDGENGMTVAGSYQVNDSKQPIRISKVFDTGKDGNGVAYELSDKPILGSKFTTDSILAIVNGTKVDKPFRKFRELLTLSGVLEESHPLLGGTSGWACGGWNIKTFNNYHYTVYVPTNESLEALEKLDKSDPHYLPVAEAKDNGWKDLKDDDPAKEERKDAQEKAIKKLADFVKYHIQDNSVFINSEQNKYEEVDYETSAISGKSFLRLKVSRDDVNGKESIKIVDREGNVRHVKVDDPDLYNLMSREYYYDKFNPLDATQIESASSAVIHYIDGPLFPNMK